MNQDCLTELKIVKSITYDFLFLNSQAIIHHIDQKIFQMSTFKLYYLKALYALIYHINVLYFGELMIDLQHNSY